MVQGAAAVMGRLETIPAHVPPELVVEFDYFNLPEAARDPHLAWKKLHDGPDIVYAPYYGGHWIVTRADDVAKVMHDPETFSNAEFTVPKRGPGNPLLMPDQLDPPRHGPVRRIALRPLAPKAITPLLPVIRELTSARIKKLLPQGRCEFVSEFTDIPVEIFFEHVNVPKNQLAALKKCSDTVARDGSEDARREARLAVARYLADILQERRNLEGTDLFSVIIAAEREGELSRDDSLALALNIFFGGLETVASALAFVVLFLARNPAHRQQLIDNPALSSDATEELLRRFGILNLARITAKETTLSGVPMVPGDMVLLPLHLATLDERSVPDAMDVNFDRRRVSHVNFGLGIHRCLGSNLARPEVRIFIEEWLKHIPEFSVDPNDEPVGRSGVAMTMTRVPLVWPV